MHTIRTIVLVAGLAFASNIAAEPLSYYLPGDVRYDAAVPQPETVIGHEVGEWHITHDRLVQYMRTLAETSDRVVWQQTGTTHEGRPLLLLAISSPRNLARLEEIRTRHLALTDPRAAAPMVDGMPAVVWMGYSVHGDEPSGSNAAPVVAYHLAAAQDEWTEQLLEETVILFDPSVNPDGLQRYSTWVNSHRGRVPVADSQTLEHNEPWPTGRANHYWFDLNRDWLLLVHPESRARIAQFQRWRPNVLTDHHEMGTNNTFFFQPGVPSRQNPLFPQRTFDLHLAIARHHAAAMDATGELYYSREGFDDFYLGKGSTYPDIQGSIGILFEQAGSEGRLQDSQNGLLEFPRAVRNQVTTSFSTLRAVREQRLDLLRWQRQFAEEAYAEGRRDNTRAWIFGDDGDAARAQRFVSILIAHGIEVHELASEVTVDGAEYRPGHAWVVPTGQPQYRLARGIFETRTEFADNTFYDVSSWTLPLAFGLPYGEMGRRFSDRVVGAAVTSVATMAAPVPPRGAYAYAFAWQGFHAPRAAFRLLDGGVTLRAATQAFTTNTADGTMTFAQGTIVVPMGLQEGVDAEHLHRLFATIAAEDGIRVHAIGSGFADSGIDIGSPSMQPVALPRIAILVGSSVRSTEVGEAWHLLDNEFAMPVSHLDIELLGRADLSRYTHLIMVDGRYNDIPEAGAGAIRTWVRGGGVLLATKGGARWAVEQDLAAVEFQSGGEITGRPDRRDYGFAREDSDEQLLRGAIFMTDLDVTHPLGWGIPRRAFPVFRDSSEFMQLPEDRYSIVAQHMEAPLLSGHISSENLAALAGTASVVAARSGRGTVVLMAENMHFRGYWWGSSRVFLNGLFFGGMIMPTANID